MPTMYLKGTENQEIAGQHIANRTD
uniref:Uncharacterized protein n=1 Tax=Anguilla anguilla TaxID=7936 RepID=A0A0E9PP46_ANGAN